MTDTLENVTIEVIKNCTCEDFCENVSVELSTANKHSSAGYHEQKNKKITNLLRVRLKSGQPNFINKNFLSLTWNIVLSIAKGLSFKNCMKSVIN